jgi:hypothetical protein
MNFDQPGRMSGQVLPLKGSEHSAVDALLPFYVNGTLQGGELDRVKQHLEGCEECRREAEWLRNVFVACEAIVPVPEDSPFADTGRMPGIAAQIPAFAGRTDAGGWRRRVSAGWAATQPWARMLLAAQLAAVAVLGTMLVSETRDDAPYRTLGAPVRGVAAGDSIAVRFDPTITESEMRRLLDSAGARIVDGPTATAAFLLEVPVGHSDAAVQKLRAERKVLFAEPLGARAER